MRKAHYITIASALALVALLYWGVKTVPSADKKSAGGSMAQQGGMPPQAINTVKPASFDSILSASRKQLSPEAVRKVDTIENELAAISDSSQMAAVLFRLAAEWEKNNQLPAAAYYSAKAAKLENSEKKLNFAGQFFLNLMQDAQSASMQMWEAQEAVACLQKAVDLNPADDTAKLELASAYIEGTGETMNGVQLLLGITREKPDDIPANLMLGRLSVQSGQNDKAIGRFETVLKQEPNNTEALYFMAQAYEAKGEKKKAIDLLEKCKAVVNKPEFSKEIDEHINSLK